MGKRKPVVRPPEESDNQVIRDALGVALKKLNADAGFLIVMRDTDGDMECDTSWSAPPNYDGLAIFAVAMSELGRAALHMAAVEQSRAPNVAVLVVDAEPGPKPENLN